MSSKISLVCGALILSLGSVGCSGMYVSKEQYDRDMTQGKEYKDALERDNAELRAKGEAYDRLKTEMEVNGEANKFYSELADSLKKALSGLGVEPGEVTVNVEKGTVQFARDVLFELGSWKISAKGQDILRKVSSDVLRGNVVKIVGHTDRKPITRPATIQALETKTNMELSCRRAIAVMGELLKDGIHENQVASCEGHGTEPTSSNSVARCVEIFVVKGAQVAPTSAVKTSTKTSKK